MMSGQAKRTTHLLYYTLAIQDKKQDFSLSLLNISLVLISGGGGITDCTVILCLFLSVLLSPSGCGIATYKMHVHLRQSQPLPWPHQQQCTNE